MTINLQKPDIRELKPKITVFGVGGGGGNAVNNMINGGLQGVEFVVANTDAQALTMSRAERVVQLGIDVTQGLGAGSQPEVGRAAAEECIDEIADHLQGTHMAFITAGMGGGTGTGAAPVVARAAREAGILTVGVVTKPFHFEGARRMKTAEAGIAELQKNVDTLIVIPNQNLFRIANDKTTFADAFGMADQVLYSGVACITDLMVKEGLINLDFADVRSVMREMGKAMMGTGESSGDGRAMQAAEAAIANPLLDETSMRGAKGLLISITGGRDMTLFEVDEAATRIREEVDADANIILGATFDEALEGVIRVSVVATGIDRTQEMQERSTQQNLVAAVSRSTAANPTSAPKPAIQAPPRPAASVPATGPVATSAPAAQAAPMAARVEKVAEALAIPAQPVRRDGVRIEAFRPTQEFDDVSIEDDFRQALEEELLPPSQSFIPDAPELPDQMVPQMRMPEVEDFPPMVRAELEKRTTPVAPTAHEDRGPIGLLRKLTHGFGSHAEEQAPAVRQEPVHRAEPAVRAPSQQASAPAHVGHGHNRPPVSQPAGRVDDNPFAPKRANLDNNGRAMPHARPIDDDDQLDIPAFLRRQGS
ncbi:MAG: cell division protein FtsZ [Nitratireductor sp.]